MLERVRGLLLMVRAFIMSGAGTAPPPIRQARHLTDCGSVSWLGAGSLGCETPPAELRRFREPKNMAPRIEPDNLETSPDQGSAIRLPYAINPYIARMSIEKMISDQGEYAGMLCCSRS